MKINTAPAPKLKVNLAELNHVTVAVQRAYRPGVCIRTLLAGIVATGSLQGMDLSQEVSYVQPRLEAAAARFASPTGQSAA